MFNGFGDRIKNMRNYLGIRQTELVGDDYSIAYLSKVENGLLIPSGEFIHLISERLQVPKQFLTWKPTDGEEGIEAIVKLFKQEGKLKKENWHVLYLMSFESLSVNLLLSIFTILLKESLHNGSIEETMNLLERAHQSITVDFDREKIKSIDRGELVEYFIACGNGYFAKQDFYRSDYYYKKAEIYLPNDGSDAMLGTSGEIF